MYEINKAKYMEDYTYAKTKKENIINEVVNEVEKLNYSVEIKQKCKEMLVAQLTNEVDREIAFYEKYLTFVEDEINNNCDGGGADYSVSV